MTTMPPGRRRGCALAVAFLLKLYAGLAAGEPAAGARILEAADHAELTAAMSADGVVRVALLDDRIVRVIRAPGGFAVEHDPDAGDLYLSRLPEPAAPRGSDNPQGSTVPQESVAAQGFAAPQGFAVPQGPASQAALFIGSEKGRTYRLTLTPVAGGPAQILIRNAGVQNEDPAPPVPEADRMAAIAGLIRAVAGGEPSEGHAVEPAVLDPAANGAIVPLSVWRGPRYEAVVLTLAAGAPSSAPELAAQLGPDVAAVWIVPASDGAAAGSPSRSRFAAGRDAADRVAVVVREAGER